MGVSREVSDDGSMKYLHTMVRVSDLAQSLAFYCDALGLRELRRHDNESGRYTLVFLAARSMLGYCRWRLQRELWRRDVDRLSATQEGKPPS